MHLCRWIMKCLHKRYQHCSYYVLFLNMAWFVVILWFKRSVFGLRKVILWLFFSDLYCVTRGKFIKDVRFYVCFFTVDNSYLIRFSSFLHTKNAFIKCSIPPILLDVFHKRTIGQKCAIVENEKLYLWPY